MAPKFLSQVYVLEPFLTRGALKDGIQARFILGHGLRRPD